MDLPSTLSYRQVSDIYDEMRRAGVPNTPSTLSAFANNANQLTGTAMFDQGVNDNFVKRTSAGIDKILENLGLTTAGRWAGEGIDRFIGQEDFAAPLLEGLPRMAVNTAPMALAAVPGLAPVGLGLSAALSGADVYEKTDSPLAGLIGGAAVPATAGLARLGGQAALKFAGAPIVNEVGSRLPQNVVQGLAQFAGMQPGQIAADLGQQAGVNWATGQENPGDLDYGKTALQNVLFNLFFDAPDVVSAKRLNDRIMESRNVPPSVAPTEPTSTAIAPFKGATPVVPSSARIVETMHEKLRALMADKTLQPNERNVAMREIYNDLDRLLGDPKNDIIAMPDRVVGREPNDQNRAKMLALPWMDNDAMSRMPEGPDTQLANVEDVGAWSNPNAGRVTDEPAYDYRLGRAIRERIKQVKADESLTEEQRNQFISNLRADYGRAVTGKPLIPEPLKGLALPAPNSLAQLQKLSLANDVLGKGQATNDQQIAEFVKARVAAGDSLVEATEKAVQKVGNKALDVAGAVDRANKMIENGEVVKSVLGQPATAPVNPNVVEEAPGVKTGIGARRSLREDGQFSNEKNVPNLTKLFVSEAAADKYIKEKLAGQPGRYYPEYVRGKDKKIRWKIMQEDRILSGASVDEAQNKLAQAEGFTQLSAGDIPQGSQKQLDDTANVVAGLGETADVAERVAQLDAKQTLTNIGVTVQSLPSTKLASLIGATNNADVQLFQNRFATVWQELGNGKNMHQIDDVLTERGIGFEDYNDLLDFLDSDGFKNMTLLSKAANGVEEKQTYVGADGKVYVKDQPGMVRQGELKGMIDKLFGKQVSQFMFAGPGATGWEQARMEGKTFPVEGGTKQAFEFSDADMKWTKGFETYRTAANKADITRESEPVKLTAIIDHPVLFEQYPDLKDLKVVLYRDPDSTTAGSFSKNTHTIRVNIAKDDSEGTILHEIQHQIQDWEGWTRGAAHSGTKEDRVGYMTQDERDTLDAMFESAFNDLADRDLYKQVNPILQNWFDGKIGYEGAMKEVAKVKWPDQRALQSAQNLVKANVMLNNAWTRYYYNAGEVMARKTAVRREQNDAKLALGHARGYPASDLNDVLNLVVKPTRDGYYIDAKAPQMQSFLRGDQSVASDSGQPQNPFALNYSMAHALEQRFRNMGMDEQQVQAHKDATMRLANTFKQLAQWRVGQITDPTILGLASSETRSGQFMGELWLNQIRDPKLSDADKLQLERYVTGHELTHGIEQMFLQGQLNKSDADKFQRVAKMFDDMEPADRVRLFNEALKTLTPDLAKNPRAQEFLNLAKDSGDEARAAIGSLVMHNLVEAKPKDMREFLSFFPQEVTDYVLSLGRLARDVIDALVAGDWQGAKGVVKNWSMDRQTAKQLREFGNGLRGLMQTKQQIDKDVSNFLNLANYEPEQFYKTAASLSLGESSFQELNKTNGQFVRVPGIGQSAAFGRESNLDDKLLAGKNVLKSGARWVKENLMPVLQMGEMHPETKPLFWLPMHHQEQMNNMTMDSMVPFAGEWLNGKEPVFRDTTMKSSERVLTSEKLQTVVSDIRRRMQETKELITDRHPEWQMLTEGLTDKERQDVLNYSNAMTTQNAWLQEQIVESSRKNIGTYAAGIIQAAANRAGVKMTFEEAQSLGARLNDAMAKGDMSTISTLQAVPGVQNAAQFVQSQQQKLAGLAKFFQDRPWFTSEQRFGDWAIRYVDKKTGKRGMKKYNDQVAYQKELSRMESDPNFVAVRGIEKSLDRESGGISKDIIQQIQEIERSKLAHLKTVLPPEVFKQVAPHISVEDELLKAKAASQLFVPGSDRKLAAGREEISMVKNQAMYVNAVIKTLATRDLRAMQSLMKLDPEVAQSNRGTQLAERNIDNYLANDSDWARNVTGANFTYFMGFNFVGHMMETLQPLMSLAPLLTEKGAGLVGSYKHVLGAMKHVTDELVTRQFRNPEHKDVIERGNKEGVIGLGAFSELVDSQGQVGTNMMRLARGQQPLDVAGFLKNPVGAYSTAARNVYSKFTRFNARVSLIASYDFYRKQGLDKETAYQKAKEVTQLGTYAGGKAARPIGLFATRGDWRGASQVLYSLQSYVAGQTAMMARQIIHGWSKNTNLTAEQKTAARKAAVQSVGMQLAAAGALGMPFVGGGLAVLQKLFPETDIEQEVAEGFEKLFGEQAGGWAYNVASRGLLDQMLPVDLSSRFGMGNVMGLSEYNGWDPSNLVGPTLSRWKENVNAIGAAAGGDLASAWEHAMPVPFKKTVNMLRNDGDIRNANGDLLLTPSDTERFLTMIGFKPGRVGDVQQLNRATARAKSVATAQRGQAVNEIVKAKTSGDSQSMLDLFYTFLESHPNVEPRSLANSVVDEIVSQTMPKDPRAELGSADSSFLSRFTGALPEPNFVDRAALKDQVLAELGFATNPKVSVRQQMRMSMVDQGLTEDPTQAVSSLLAQLAGGSGQSRPSLGGF